jgi:hypothetical protein
MGSIWLLEWIYTIFLISIYQLIFIWRHLGYHRSRSWIFKYCKDLYEISVSFIFSSAPYFGTSLVYPYIKIYMLLFVSLFCCYIWSHPMRCRYSFMQALFLLVTVDKLLRFLQIWIVTFWWFEPWRLINILIGIKFNYIPNTHAYAQRL